MAVTSNVVTGTITSNPSILYTAPSSGVSKLVNFTVTNNSANNAVINIDSVDSSVDNFETYTALGVAYSGDPFSVTSQESSPDGVAFNDTGTKMYAVGSSQDRIFEYDLTTAWDIKTAIYNGANTSISVSSPGDITFGNNGLKVYVGWTNVLGSGVELDLGVAYDITSVTASSTIQNSTPWTGSDYYTIPGFSFNDDGTKVYVLAAYSNRKLVEMPLATAWNVSSAIFASRVELSLPPIPAVSSAVPSSDGKRFYYTDATADIVREIELTTAWDLSTATDSVRTFSVSSQTTSPGGIALGDSDSKLFIIGGNNDTIFKYDLSFFGEEYVTPWTLSNPSFAHKSPLLTSQESNPYGLEFKSDGTKLYVIGTQSSDILQYSLSTPFDVSTATYDSIATTGLVGSGFDLVFKRDGTKVFVNDGARHVEEYNLSTPWDLSTISSMVNQLDTNVEFGGSGSQLGLYVKPDGTRLYVGSTDSPYIQQYNLSTAWDLSTATANSTVGSTVTYGIGFTDDGTIMFSTEPGNILRKWNLSTPWEVNTAVSDSTYDLNNLESASGSVNSVFGFKLIPSKSQIAVADRGRDNILTYNTSESAGVGIASAGKHSLRKSSTVFPNQTSKINIGALVMGANTNIRASSTEDVSYSITTQELSGDIASGFSVENKSLTLGTLKQTILEATGNVRIYGCQVTNFNGASTATFTTYLNDTPIVSSKQVEAGDSVLGITPGLSLTAGDVLSIEPGGIGDIQVSLTYETY